MEYEHVLEEFEEALEKRNTYKSLGYDTTSLDEDIKELEGYLEIHR